MKKLLNHFVDAIIMMSALAGLIFVVLVVLLLSVTVLGFFH